MACRHGMPRMGAPRRGCWPAENAISFSIKETGRCFSARLGAALPLRFVCDLALHVYGFRHTNAHADHHGDQAVRVRFTRLPCTVAACMCVRAGSLVSGGADIVIAVPSVSPICTVTRRARRPRWATNRRDTYHPRPATVNVHVLHSTNARASGGLYRYPGDAHIPPACAVCVGGAGRRWRTVGRAAND